jgi:hypothetical protein
MEYKNRLCAAMMPKKPALMSRKTGPIVFLGRILRRGKLTPKRIDAFRSGLLQCEKVNFIRKRPHKTKFRSKATLKSRICRLFFGEKSPTIILPLIIFHEKKRI